MATLVGALTAAMGRVTGVARRALSRDDSRTGASTTVAVAADRDGALLVSAAALRHLGARIIRYEIEAGVVQARGGTTGALIEVRTCPPEPAAATDPGEITRLRVWGAGTEGRRLVRRFRGALSRPPSPEGR